jgi:hypothetical protein
MEYLNKAAFEDNGNSQESWLTPSPGKTSRVPSLDLQTQGLQVFPSSTTASGAFPLIIPARNAAVPKKNVPVPSMLTQNGAFLKQMAPPLQSGAPMQIPGQHSAMPTPGGHTPFCGFLPPGFSMLNLLVQFTPKDRSQQFGVTYVCHTPTPGGHAPLCGFPATEWGLRDLLVQSPAQDSSQEIAQDISQKTAQDSSQKTHVFTQLGIKRIVHLDYLLYS